ncbi:MAG TPA: DUF2231 domain-containing protein [Armatimonadota bacterium]|jgi:mono/diheme cytochrome c family protein
MPVPSWLELHGALTHFPIALLLTACAFEIVGAVLRRPDVRQFALWLLVGAVLTALPSLATGWLAGGDLFGRSGSPPRIFVLHRAAAFATAGGAALLLAWRLVRRDKLSPRAQSAAALALIGCSLCVGFTGYLGGKMVLGGQALAALAQADTPPATAEQPALPAPADTSAAADTSAGRALYKGQGCPACHHMDGAGGRVGPDLTHEARRHGDVHWQVAHLKDPGSLSPGSTMPGYERLSAAELDSLARYLVSRR